MNSTTNRTITTWFPREETARTIGFTFSGQTVGSAVAAPVVGLLAIQPDRMAALEAIVHPLVRAASADFLARHAAAPLVVLDIPLLYETGGEGRCDAVAVVSAPPEIQRARVLARPGMTEAAFAAILAKQMPDAEKRARADFVIDTGRGFPAAEAEVARLVARLTAHRAPPHRGDG
ncbi:dephospho-CoA kinase [Methylobacterium radiotolerans]|uniref:dephospho-CoA kinase n=1 Tax=Methylobacterium radiotolerans TaxID=31998 RepID=UPI002F352F0A